MKTILKLAALAGILAAALVLVGLDDAPYLNQVGTLLFFVPMFLMAGMMIAAEMACRSLQDVNLKLESKVGKLEARLSRAHEEIARLTANGEKEQCC